MTKVAKTRVAAKPRVAKAEAKPRVAKITISLPREQVEQAREAVARDEASSVSGYISAALVAVRPLLVTDEQDTLTAFAADLIAEDGVPSAEAYARADRFLAMSEPD
jgi:Arc/MetJ-type ribon-helix-helix transcriptional regulator